jgi:hypothetical protein
MAQVHISGLPTDDADDESIVAALEACGLNEESGLVTTQIMRDRDTDTCRCEAGTSGLERETVGLQSCELLGDVVHTDTHPAAP